MNTKHLISLFLVVFCMISIMPDLEAQRRGTKKRESRDTDTTERSRSSRDRDSDEYTVALRDRLIYDIQLGQLGFSRGFTISAKGGAAYKFTDRLSLGIGLKTFYYLENNPGSANDISVFNYGPYIYPRFKISEQFYLKGEYYYISFDNDPFNTGNSDRITEGIPMFGAGYLSGFGPWKFGIELLFIPSDSDRDLYYGDVFEYMFSFIYNF